MHEAIARFRGKHGYRRVDCAEALAVTYQESFSLDAEFVGQSRAWGRGRAPEGSCGAWYVADRILSDAAPEGAEKLLTAFHDAAATVNCREIRKGKKLSCMACMNIAIDKLDEAARRRLVDPRAKEITHASSPIDS